MMGLGGNGVAVPLTRLGRADEVIECCCRFQALSKGSFDPVPCRLLSPRADKGGQGADMLQRIQTCHEID